ncbi:alpha/beta hydrolase [Streptomyces tailanensis]|uniref:alpha/beta hydrolase n=1 Tax=Streptomyces tailanensis TaxID=2569858 RepID=UPI00122E5E0F|nr:alpha/beta hydrolase [Streptomyces tailanensis]
MGTATRHTAELDALTEPTPEPRTRLRRTRTHPHGTRTCTRLLRTLLALLIATAVIMPVSAAAAGPQIPAPAPATLAAPTPKTLESTYAANRTNAERASHMAEAHGDRSRAATDRAMAAPTRQFLKFDGRGPGQAVEVFGDLLKADRVAVLVPGSDTSLDTYDRFHKAARALYDRMGTGTAVIAWLGYETPKTISTTVLTPTRAEQAAPKLRTFIRDLRGLLPSTAHVTLVCHSYGSVVCGRAAAGLNGVTDIALIGSPGTGADSAATLHTSARIWAARGTDDWVGMVPHTRADLFGTTVGFGTDPISPTFGARVFPADNAGHSDYFTPGSLSLEHLARITLGIAKERTHA